VEVEILKRLRIQEEPAWIALVEVLYSLRKKQEIFFYKFFV